MRRRDIGGFIRPDCRGAQPDLRQNQCQSQKNASFVSEIFSTPSRSTASHAAARHTRQNQKRNKAMNHLQNNLECGDGIFTVGFLHTMRIASCGNGAGAGVRPEFSVGRRKIRNRQSRVLMPHRRADEELGENQNRDEQNMIAQQPRGIKIIFRAASSFQARLVKSAIAQTRTKKVCATTP